MPDELTRRRAMKILAGAAGTVLGYGCGGGTDSTSNEAGADGGASTGDGNAACSASPEGEIGPYFADDSASAFQRSNILSSITGADTQSGVPLTLTITVVDSEKDCVPYPNAQVDIWHCNAKGVYSDIAAEGTTADTWLRGYQITDARGRVTFVTIIPGWYQGRTTHIHLRIRSSYSAASSTSDGTNTTQLFFNQALVDTLSMSVAPYDTEGVNPTTNATDHVYAQEVEGANLLVLEGDIASGYTASVTLGLPITGNGFDAGGPGPGGPGTP
jgi:protocatechuate 3,4-dioxygenase beta subunit